MEQQHIVICDASSGLVHILPFDANKNWEWEDEDFQKLLEEEGIRASDCEWMTVRGNDFLKFGWSSQ